MDHGSLDSGRVGVELLLALVTIGLSDLGEFHGLECVELALNSSKGKGSTKPLLRSAIAAGDRGLPPTEDRGRGRSLTEVLVFMAPADTGLAVGSLDLFRARSGKGAGGLCGFVR